jgi:pimeloyl-ACP methyl ester carboxylesterase
MAHFKYDGKKVYFNTYGKKGPFLLLLHGNSTASSMFKREIKRFYEKRFRVFTFDYPGHGKSARVDKFPEDFWYENSKVAIALFERLGVDKAYVIGTSGGAMVALNIALERPDLVIKCVCDSLIGEKMPLKMAQQVKQSRLQEKNGEMGFAWFMLHGFSWEKVVDQDTEMILNAAEKSMSFYHKNPASVNVRVLLTGSTADPMLPGLETVYKNLIAENSNYEMHMFATGGHMTMLTNNYEFSRLAVEFFNR